MSTSSKRLDDNLTAYTTLAYKSNRTHAFEETVGEARSRVKTAIRRKSLKWAKVTVPSPDGTKVRVHFFEPGKGWTVTVAPLPKTKD